MTGEAIVFEGKAWEPYVKEVDGRLFYHLPVESGHVSKSFEFEIAQKHLDVLRSDPERYYFLFAVLHPRYQPVNARAPDGLDRHFDLILLGEVPQVERLLNMLDADTNGAVSNLVRLKMGRDQSLMRAGTWFLGAVEEGA